MNTRILIASIITFSIHYGLGSILEKAGLDYHPAVWKSLLVVGLAILVEIFIFSKNDKSKRG